MALLLVFGLRFALSSFVGYQIVKAVTALKKKLRSDLNIKLQKQGPVFITSQGTGSVVNTLVDGVETIGKYYADYLPAKALMKALPLSILLFVFPIDWQSGLVMIVTAPMITVFMILIGKGAEKLNQKQWEKLARMSNHFLNVVQGLTTLKIFGASKSTVKSIADTAEQYRKETMKVLRVAFLSSVTLEFFSTVSIAIIAVVIGFRLMWGEMAFFNGFFVLLLAPEFYLPLRKMGAAYHARMEAIGAAEKIAIIMETRENEGETNKTQIPSDAIAFRFKDIHHTYHGRGKSLNGVSFDIAPGSKIALVGPSGAGKSTIMALILGFIKPDEGQIFINDAPLSAINIEEWRKNISWIPQNPTLFYGSVMDNIRMGRQNASDADIINLCHELNIDAFIQNLPQGYETLIGEKGYGLSGGQVQCLAIARAFLRDAPLILMDEPTASLDHTSEEILYRAMHDLTKDKTVLTIAHRLYTIDGADQILFLQDGEIVDNGTHKDLVQRNDAYVRQISSGLFNREAA